jgi:hypothetical protein
MQEWWERAVIPRVFRELERIYPFSRVNDANDSLAAANGQYILIRRGAYEAVGGHRSVRNEVVEDLELARRVKGAGFRIWFGSGEGVVSARMYRNAPDMLEGWRKNLFPLYNRDYWAICRTSLRLICLYILPPFVALILEILSGPPTGVWFLVMILLAVQHARFWLTLPDEAAWKKALETSEVIPGVILFLLILWDSARLHSRQRVITWKGRRYRVATQDLSPSGTSIEKRQAGKS